MTGRIRTLAEQEVIREVAGMISTLQVRPSSNHPEECIPLAEQIFDRLQELGW